MKKSLVQQVTYLASLVLKVQRQENFLLHHVTNKMRSPLNFYKGTTRIAKACVWLELNSLALLLQNLVFGARDADDYRIALDAFYNAMVNAWGAHNITPYMHILKVHGP